MSELNEKFPEILLAYIADVGCEFSNTRLNELSKFVSELELDIARLAQSNLALTSKIERLQKQVDTLEDEITDKLETSSIDMDWKHKPNHCLACGHEIKMIESEEE